MALEIRSLIQFEAEKAELVKKGISPEVRSATLYRANLPMLSPLNNRDCTETINIV